MILPRLQRGFTLVEVLVAMVVLATISTGLLATTWRLVGFARDEAEHMVADNYCHDVTWAVYSQHYTNMLAWVDGAGEKQMEWTIFPEEKQDLDNSKLQLSVPQVTKVDMFGRTSVEYLLWRSGDENLRPKCIVCVNEKALGQKEICVTVKWHNGKDWQSHSNVVMRTNVERGFGQ